MVLLKALDACPIDVLLMMDSGPTAKRMRRTLEAGNLDGLSECSHEPCGDPMIKIIIGLRYICRLAKGNDYVRRRTSDGEDFRFVFILQRAMLSDVTVACLLLKVNEDLCSRHQIYVGRAQDLTLRHYGEHPIEGTNTVEDVLRALCHQPIQDAAICSDDGGELFLWVDLKAPVRELTASGMQG